MTTEYEVSKQNEVRQLREKAVYDKEAVHAILDAGILAHVAFVQGGAPVVVPMLYGRDGEPSTCTAPAKHASFTCSKKRIRRP